MAQTGVLRNRFYIPNLEDFFQNFLRVMYDCNIALRSSNTDLDRVDYLLRNISEYEETIRVMYGRVCEHHEHTSPLPQCFEQLMQIVHNTVDSLHPLYRENGPGLANNNGSNYGHREPFRSELVSSGQAGRPRFNITEEQIVVLRERLGFRWTDIASLLHVSTRTLNRRRRENGLPVGQAQSFSQITNDELDNLIKDILTVTPQSGLGLIRGALRSRGLLVQRHRVISALQRLDPVTSALRMSRMIIRRKYNVPCPNALW